MPERVVLTLDVGTQSTRALIISRRGKILHKEQIKHEPAYFSLQADWAERHADFYFDAICTVCKAAREAVDNSLWKRIAAVSLTTIRATTVLVDQKMKPLRPAFLWLDRRKASGMPEISAINRMLFRAVNMEQAVIEQWKVSPVNWVKENEPDLWEKTYKFLLLSGYLIYRLTGEMKDSVSAQVGYVPFDHRNRQWMARGSLTRFLFDIEKEKLVDTVEAGQQLGHITQEAAQATGLSPGLPLYASGADKACETIGLGCIDPSTAALSLGTTSTVTFTIGRYVEPERFVPAYASMLPGASSPEVEIFRGYWLLNWFKKEFASKELAQAQQMGISADQLLNERLKEIPPGCDGLVFQPYFTPNLTMPNARGSVIGFSDIHTRIHIYRSIIEGINFALMSGLNTMEKRADVKVEELRLGGGGSQSDEICQITANMFGIPAVRTQTHEVSGIGSAMAAFVGLGVFKSLKDGIQHMVHRQDVFEPNMQEHKIYRDIYQNIFLQVNDKLAPLYAKQKGIMGNKRSRMKAD
ncbi:MAG: carbohydrate kinase [Clostridiales bacterium]|nr:carbohydrate kinase [Clostridiales bacterium]